MSTQTMQLFYRYPLHILILLVMLSGCDRQTEQKETKPNKPQSSYVDFKKFAQGRPCSQVRFICLPESQDKSWQSLATSDHIEDLEITPEVKKKFDKIVKDWNSAYDDYYSKTHQKGERKPMLITELNKEFFDKVERRRFFDSMEKQLAKEFPDFWRETPKKVRYRWIRRAMNKAKQFGYDPKQNQPMIELCARIGVDFDRDPKWEYITKFIKRKRVNVVLATRYLDYTIFGKDIDRTGDKITDWSMRGAHPGLPYPKKPYPKLND